VGTLGNVEQQLSKWYLDFSPILPLF
jgi:hypothetical protein